MTQVGKRNLDLIRGKMIYLASPFSHSDKSIEEARYISTMEAVALLFNQGVFVYSPIVHCYEMIKRFKLPSDALFWERYNHAFIDKSKYLYVLCDSGWRESKGVTEEINYALSKQYPVEYLVRWPGMIVNVTLDQSFSYQATQGY